MYRSGMKDNSLKHIPVTIDAIRFGRHYLDPKDLRLKCLNTASIGLVITGIVISVFYFL